MINMKLWIRSQDKMTLCKCNNIYIDDEWVDPYYIKDDTLTLGIYKTKERTLEVLDEIQNILIDYKEMSRVVYQMPEE